MEEREDIRARAPGVLVLDFCISITHAPSGQVLHKEVIALSVIKWRSDTVIDTP